MPRFAPQHLEEHHDRSDAHLLALGRIASVAFGVFVLLRLPVYLTLGAGDWAPIATFIGSDIGIEYARLSGGQQVVSVVLDVITGGGFVASGLRDLPLMTGIYVWLGSQLAFVVIGQMIVAGFGL